jgi:hypothetical protein
MIKMYIGLHESTPYYRQILIKLDLSRQIFEKSNFMKFRPVRAKLFHEDRRIDGLT